MKALALALLAMLPAADVREGIIALNAEQMKACAESACAVITVELRGMQPCRYQS